MDLDPRNLPTATLYRVQYDGCMTTYEPGFGLTAKDTETCYDECDDIDFVGAIEDHLSWRPVPSPFISTFADKRLAENWALKWSARHDGDTFEIFEISASELVGSYIFHADKLWKRLYLQVPSRAEASILKEYLVAWNIPQRAIVGSRSMEDIQRGRLSLLREQAKCVEYEYLIALQSVVAKTLFFTRPFRPCVLSAKILQIRI